MNSRFIRFFSIILLYIFLFSGSSAAYKPHPQGIHPKQKHNIRLLLATSVLDNVPIVNPTPPGSTTTPTSSSTEPVTNPTAPVTTPTSPKTNTFPTVSTPTSPGINPSPTISTPTPLDTNPSPTVSTPTPLDTNLSPTVSTPTPLDINPTTTPTVPTTIPSPSGGSWCVANQGASPTTLQVNLDYVCSYGGSDCSAIQTGGSCYEPNTIQNHASYAFNDYYQKHRDPTSCVFGGAAQLTNTDPSTGNCHYAASSSIGVSPPASMTPPATMSPPSTTTMAPPFSMTPQGFTASGGDMVYGSAVPTGFPNSAISVSFRFCPIYLAISLVWSLVAAHIV